MMKYQMPEMDIIELEFIDTAAFSENSAEGGIWEDGTPGGNEQKLTVETP